MADENVYVLQILSEGWPYYMPKSSRVHACISAVDFADHIWVHPHSMYQIIVLIQRYNRPVLCVCLSMCAEICYWQVLCNHHNCYGHWCGYQLVQFSSVLHFVADTAIATLTSSLCSAIFYSCFCCRNTWLSIKCTWLHCVSISLLGIYKPELWTVDRTMDWTMDCNLDLS